MTAAAPDGVADAAAIADWLLREARALNDADALVLGLVERLGAAGVPVDRLTTAFPTLHTTRRGLGRFWTRENGVISQDFPWDNEAAYQASPFRVAHESRDWVRFRLDAVGDETYGIVPDLREAGYVDYICMPVFFRDGSEGGLTLATRRPAGFQARDLAILRLVEPAIAGVLDLERAWVLIDETFRMYVGDEPHARILSGEVRRGAVMRIRSAILFADMRGFTALSTTMSAEETVALLDRYFDCVVPPIEARGGQVLKYIGDGVLAIFRAGDDPVPACEAALAAAEAIVARVADAAREEPAAQRFGVKTALHFGEVAYGNIGSGARLDFTVIGSGVNITSRLADLAGNLDRPTFVSAAFAETLPDRRFRSLGRHPLRGVPTEKEVLEPVSE